MATVLATNIAGESLMEGNQNSPCAVFQEGRMLLLINEHANVAVGQLEDESRLIVRRGEGWQSNLRGDLSNDRKTISWRNDTSWSKQKDR